MLDVGEPQISSLSAPSSSVNTTLDGMRFQTLLESQRLKTTEVAGEQLQSLEDTWCDSDTPQLYNRVNTRILIRGIKWK